MKVCVIDHFDSMHLLPGHPKCGVPHGHTYKLEVVAEGPVVNGMVIDFADHADVAKLGDGYRVQVRVVLWQEPDVLKVPMAPVSGLQGVADFRALARIGIPDRALERLERRAQSRGEVVVGSGRGDGR